MTYLTDRDTGDECCDCGRCLDCFDRANPSDPANHLWPSTVTLHKTFATVRVDPEVMSNLVRRHS